MPQAVTTIALPASITATVEQLLHVQRSIDTSLRFAPESTHDAKYYASTIKQGLGVTPTVPPHVRLAPLQFVLVNLVTAYILTPTAMASLVSRIAEGDYFDFCRPLND